MVVEEDKKGGKREGAGEGRNKNSSFCRINPFRVSNQLLLLPAGLACSFALAYLPMAPRPASTATASASSALSLLYWAAICFSIRSKSINWLGSISSSGS